MNNPINPNFFINNKLVQKMVGNELTGEDRKEAIREIVEPILDNIELALDHIYNIDGRLIWAYKDGSHSLIKTSSSSKFLYGIESYGVISSFGIDTARLREYIFTRERELVEEVDPMLDTPLFVEDSEKLYQKSVVEINSEYVTQRAKDALISHYGQKLIDDIGVVMAVSPYVSNKKKTQFIITGGTNTGKTTLLKAFKPLGVACDIKNTKVITSHDPSPYRASQLHNKSLIFDDIVPNDELYNLNGEVTLSPKGRMSETATVGALFFTLADIERIGSVDKQQINRMTVIQLPSTTLDESCNGIPMEESVESLKALALESYRKAHRVMKDVRDANRAIERIINDYKVDELENWDDAVKQEVVDSLVQGTYENSMAIKNGSVIVKDITSTEQKKNGEMEIFMSRPKQAFYAILSEVNGDLIPNLKKKTISYLVDLLPNAKKSTLSIHRDDGSSYTVNGLRIKIKVNPIEDDPYDIF